MNLDECIRYSTDVVYQLSSLPKEKRNYFLKAVGRIQKRAGNPYLHVALIGDFSTGKSTFINALIRKNILKTAWHATTAVPTFIYCYDQDRMQIMVETTDGEKYRLDKREQFFQFEEKLNISLPLEEKDIIAFLSTSNSFAADIKRIGIRLPGSEGFNHVCIIDTPGVNPGAEEEKPHVIRTQNVLREYADATIVLFQKTQVYSASFSRFLEENAGHFMGDAVFIITMMDLAQEEEREELMEYVRHQLKQAFGLEAPLVFECCAKAAVSERTDNESRYWTVLFDEMRDELIGYMADGRKRMIRRQMVSLLEDLIHELDKEVAFHLSAIEHKRKCLEESAVISIRNQKEKENLFKREKLKIQGQRHEDIHQKLLEYLCELKQEGM